MRLHARVALESNYTTAPLEDAETPTEGGHHDRDPMTPVRRQPLPPHEGTNKLYPPDDIPGSPLSLAGAQWEACTSCGEEILPATLLAELEAQRAGTRFAAERSMTTGLVRGAPEIAPHELAARLLQITDQDQPGAVDPARLLSHLRLQFLPVDFAASLRDVLPIAAGAARAPASNSRCRPAASPQSSLPRASAEVHGLGNQPSRCRLPKLG